MPPARPRAQRWAAALTALGLFSAAGGACDDGPPPPRASPEFCNSVDDDLDGATDEGGPEVCGDLRSAGAIDAACIGGACAFVCAEGLLDCNPVGFGCESSELAFRTCGDCRSCDLDEACVGGDCEPVWSWRLLSPTAVQGVAVRAAGDGVVVSGFVPSGNHMVLMGHVAATGGDGFVARLEGELDPRWVALAELAEVDARVRAVETRALAIDGEGDVLVGGAFAGDALFVDTLSLDATTLPPGHTGWLARLDGESGRPRWLRSASAPCDECELANSQVRSLAAGGGRVVFGGERVESDIGSGFFGATTLDGETLFRRAVSTSGDATVSWVADTPRGTWFAGAVEGSLQAGELAVGTEASPRRGYAGRRGEGEPDVLFSIQVPSICEWAAVGDGFAAVSPGREIIAHDGPPLRWRIPVGGSRTCVQLVEEDGLLIALAVGRGGPVQIGTLVIAAPSSGFVLVSLDPATGAVLGHRIVDIGADVTSAVDVALHEDRQRLLVVGGLSNGFAALGVTLAVSIPLGDLAPGPSPEG